MRSSGVGEIAGPEAETSHPLWDIHQLALEIQGIFSWCIEHDPVARELFIRVDRAKITSHGKPSIRRMWLKIHIWQATADINACQPFYEALSAVDGEYETWRQIVVSKPELR